MALCFCCSYHCCFISCIVTDEEPRGPVSSQDVHSEEETVEKVPGHQVAPVLLHQSVRLIYIAGFFLICVLTFY